MNPDGSDHKTIVTNCHLPDGIVVDAEIGHVYWTNMGVPNLDDGSIERADLVGRNRRIIVPQGVTHTPKQIHLDKENGKLYWSDREGMRVMRANLDGSHVETLVETGRGEEQTGLAGIAENEFAGLDRLSLARQGIDAAAFDCWLINAILVTQ
jgi:hypothetical protein